MASNKSSVLEALFARFDRIAAWHKNKTNYVWLTPLPMSKALALFAVIMAMMAAMINYQVRDNQYQIWQANPDIYFLDNTPLFSTTDASFFLGMAREYRETGDANNFNKRRLYPNYDKSLEEAEPQDSLFDFPLLSVLIATLTTDSSTENLLKTGNALIPILAFVMALGIVIAFGAAGFWLEGAVAAIGAGLCYSFLVRTSIGRIDTDILNLGFFYAVLGLTIFAGRAQSLRAAMIWAVAAALMLNLFFWWYEKAFMGWAFLIGLMWLSFMTSRDWRRPLILAALFALFSGLAFKTISVSSDYLQASLSYGSLIYPNTFNTITELRIVPFQQILRDISGSLWIGVFSVVGLGIFALRHPVLAVVYGPASIFALANFLVGNRAIFYSAPMLWFGAAYLTMVIIRLIYNDAPKVIKDARFAKEGVGLAAMLVLIFVGYSANQARHYVPNPTFPKEMMRGFAAMKGNLPEGAVIATWWDYGYASHLFNGYRTFHDGGTQKTPVTHYVARAFLAPDQAETARILRYLAVDGLEGISDNSADVAIVEQAFAEGPTSEAPPIYLVLTEQMGRWMGSMTKLGLWDTKAGQPISLANVQPGQPLFYSENRCAPGQSAQQIICNNAVIDLKLGTVANQPLLHGISQAKDGNITARQSFHDGATTMLHLADISNVGTRILSFHERLARTSFHQLFHLGQADNRLFDLVYDAYPHMRIYRLK